LTGLNSVLANTNLDITKIVDENGFTLVHLAAYVDSDACLETLFEHVRNQDPTKCLFDEDSDLPTISRAREQQVAVFDPKVLSDWVNTATLTHQGSTTGGGTPEKCVHNEGDEESKMINISEVN